MNKYYIAFCYRNKKCIGFGDLIIENKEELSLETKEDIENLKDYLRKKSIERNLDTIEDITIMDWRKLKNE